MAEQQTAIQAWVQQVERMLALGRQIVSVGDTFTRIYQANGIGATIGALQPGEVLPGTSITKETAMEWLTVWNALAVALNTPIESIGGQTPAQVLFKM